jgi:hypothetical protein
MNLRRLRREWRRLSPLQRLGLVAAAVAVFAGLGHETKATTSRPGPVTSASGNVALGQQLASPYGWGSGTQWTCLYDLWQQESGWSNTAENASDAYGIAQALGHGPTNQYPAGPANPPASSASAQIAWGLGYVHSIYGNPCNAWSHEEADGWY